MVIAEKKNKILVITEKEKKIMLVTEERNKIPLRIRILISIEHALHLLRTRYSKYREDLRESYRIHYAYPNTLPNRFDMDTKMTFHIFIVAFYLIDSSGLALSDSWVKELSGVYMMIAIYKPSFDFACYRLRFHPVFAEESEFEQYGPILFPILIEMFATWVCCAVFVFTIITFSLYPNVP